MDENFVVEGRYFPDALLAFTFAGIQADRMRRPVEVHIRTGEIDEVMRQRLTECGKARKMTTWHATAQPSHFVRRHLVKEGVPQ